MPYIVFILEECERMSMYFHSVGNSNLFTYKVWGFHCGKESYFGLLVGNHLPNYLV